jgi:hypothetical protein
MRLERAACLCASAGSVGRGQPFGLGEIPRVAPAAARRCLRSTGSAQTAAALRSNPAGARGETRPGAARAPLAESLRGATRHIARAGSRAPFRQLVQVGSRAPFRQLVQVGSRAPFRQLVQVEPREVLQSRPRLGRRHLAGTHTTHTHTHTHTQ